MESITLAWLREAVGPLGETVDDRATVPANPFRLLRLIVEAPEFPV